MPDNGFEPEAKDMVKEVDKIGKGRAKKLKRFLVAYTKALGYSVPGRQLTSNQHLIRLCNKNAKMGAAIRPAGGKVTNEQMDLLFRYMADNPVGDLNFKWADFFPERKAPTPLAPPKENIRVKARKRKRIREREIAKRNDFYKTWEWRTLRMEVLKKYGPVCQCCGATRGDVDISGNPVRIVVDHIKPLSRNWELRLDFNNLQILCDECNMGKGAWDETDWREAS